ncbi:MAG: isoprenoid biosynthesis glyoxalase ElbB [Gammaproteobacteria bacterium]
MKNIAVVLSGCGVLDGSEIHESVLTLLAISRAGAHYHCLAPNIPQHGVVNHATGQKVPGASRNVLEEAARIARGHIKDISQANVTNYDACIFPGGVGASMNLSDFGLKGADCTVNPDVLRFAQAMAVAKKPIGFICIAPNLIAKIYGPGVKMTIGTDLETAQTLTQMGNIHQHCSVYDIVVDKNYKVISTPAYMLGKSISEVADGINKLVEEILI